MSTGTMELVDLSTLVDVPITCEHVFHENDRRLHDGDAEYIQRGGECSCPSDVSAFVCAKWRGHVSNLAREGKSLYCRTCKTSFPAETITFERI